MAAQISNPAAQSRKSRMKRMLITMEVARESRGGPQRHRNLPPGTPT
jgi:hypothetical protein